MEAVVVYNVVALLSDGGLCGGDAVLCAERIGAFGAGELHAFHEASAGKGGKVGLVDCGRSGIVKPVAGGGCKVDEPARGDADAVMKISL